MLGDLFKKPESEGKEKHVPILMTKECQKETCGEDCIKVKVIVGKEVAHPNTAEHHIKWVKVFGKKENGMLIDLLTADFGPGYSKPYAVCHIGKGQFEEIYALSYCNIHGIWENSIKL